MDKEICYHFVANLQNFCYFKTDFWTTQLFHSWRTKFLLPVQSIKITSTFLSDKLPKYRIFHWNFRKILRNFKNRETFIFFWSSRDCLEIPVSLIFRESWQLCHCLLPFPPFPMQKNLHFLIYYFHFYFQNQKCKILGNNLLENILQNII